MISGLAITPMFIHSLKKSKAIISERMSPGKTAHFEIFLFTTKVFASCITTPRLNGESGFDY